MSVRSNPFTIHGAMVHASLATRYSQNSKSTRQMKFHDKDSLDTR